MEYIYICKMVSQKLIDKKMTQFTQEDFKIFEEIEEIRENIKKQNHEIKFLDFGAGNPEDTRDDKMMSQGVPTIKYTSELCQIGLKNNWAQLIYSLVKENKPNTILELGTCCGFSSIYMSKASNSSTIYTIEGACEVAKIATQNIQKANCDNIIQKIGKFNDILKPLLQEIKNVDFAFIDGHHDKDATIKYFEEIKPFLTKNAIVIFDDISWSEGMKESWQIITQDKGIKKYENLEKLGICYL